MLTYQEVKDKILLEDVNLEFQKLAQKCAVISSFDQICFEDLVDVLFREFHECFCSPPRDVYFLLRVGDKNQTLYTYKMIFDKCMYNVH